MDQSSCSHGWFDHLGRINPSSVTFHIEKIRFPDSPTDFFAKLNPHPFVSVKFRGNRLRMMTPKLARYQFDERTETGELGEICFTFISGSQYSRLLRSTPFEGYSKREKCGRWFGTLSIFDMDFNTIDLMMHYC